MASNGADDAEEDNILYDLLIHEEWPQESELFVKAIKERPRGSLVGRFASVAERSLWTFLRSVGYPLRTSKSCTLPTNLIQLVNNQINWHIAVSSESRKIAVLQDVNIEIRSSADEYATVSRKCTVEKDPYPQWRKLTWSPDCTMLAYSDSKGNVHIFDIMGGQLCFIPSEKSKISTVPLDFGMPVDLSCAVSGLIFTEFKPTSQWSAELLIINYQGYLRSYLISPTGELTPNHNYLFTGSYPRGVTSVAYNPNHAMLVIGGCNEDPGTGQPEDQISEAAKCGITAWRILSGQPHYKLITDYSEELGRASSKIGFLRRLRSVPMFKKSSNQDGIYQMCMSPDGCFLATIHYSGQLSLWDIPSLKRRKVWDQQDQPGFDEENPVNLRAIKKQSKENPWKYNLIDVNFWSNEALILARCSGSLSVSSVKTLQNLLGESCEWFEPCPRITVRHGKGFLGLECESKLVSLKRRRRDTDEESETASDRGHEDDSEDEEDATFVTKTTKFLKEVLYYATDFERFQPPRKKPKIIERTYRLVALKETTPEELYARKIDNEEYGEALALARKYGLDSDMVYQRQWRKSKVSIASISDYLSKITKRSWVLHECLERVPEDIDAAKELLKYGLRGTDLEALIAIGKGEDRGRFILCGDTSYDDVYEDLEEDTEERRKEREQKRRQELLEQVDFNNLMLEQKELCRSRLKILTYLDRLDTYEVILGGPHAAEERFDDKYFRKFRSQNIVEAAVEFARDGDWQALDSIFTYHGSDTLPHRLAIISNFPETMSPFEYRHLLPQAGFCDNEPDVLEWPNESWREKDWCEEEICKSNVESIQIDLGDFLYEDHPQLEKYRTAEPGSTLLTDWYRFRACEIEELSRQVENALELVRLGIEKNVQGLNDLLDDLVTMETVIYECFTEPTITFEKFQRLNDIDKLRTMMAKPTKEMYIKNVRNWMIPFLQRCDRREKGSAERLMREYIVTMAKDDLTFPLMIFENSKKDQPHQVISDRFQRLSIAMECIYNCERDDQLIQAWGIFQCLPKKSLGLISEEESRLYNHVHQLENHLIGAGILEDNKLQVPIHVLRDTQDNVDEAKQILVKLTRLAARRKPPLKESGWRQLLKNLIQLQKKVYNCIDQNVCCEIFTESLLGSEKTQNFKLAGEMMVCSSTEIDSDVNNIGGVLQSAMHSESKVPYNRAIQLVLNAAMEYFNSSANLNDPCMLLARECLLVIKDKPPQIQVELDLIEAIPLLDAFAVSILPLQVRLCEDRIDLVIKALQSSSKAYKQKTKLLNLAKLLRVSGENEAERNGRVLVLIAEYALQVNDYRGACQICCDLMSQRYQPAWAVCKQLGECEDFKDLTERKSLLSYALTYCDADVIETLMNSRSLLETQILYQTLDIHKDADTQQTDDGSSTSEQAGVYHSPLQKTRAVTRDVLTNTTMTTKAVLATVSDKQWWKNTLKWMRPLSHSNTETDGGVNNSSMERQGSHAFYETVLADPFLSQIEMDYNHFTCNAHDNSTVQFLSHSLLRTGQLEEIRTNGTSQQPTSEVLLELARNAITEDAVLALGYLLALPKPEDAEEIFEKLPRTAVSLQLAAYYYALQIYNILNPSQSSDVSQLYTHSPNMVIDVVISHVTSQSNPDWPHPLTSLVPLLQNYVELLADFMQGQMLQSLGRGVDVARFTRDNNYKQETIVGLAMTSENEVFEISVSLAKRYGLSLWEVYMTHLEFLFSESGLSTKEIEERVKSLGILPILVKDSKNFYQRSKMYIYPSIEGKDHTRLIYYYTLLDNCDENDITEDMKPDLHLKLLKKIKSAMQGLDYIKLVDGEDDPLDVIKPGLHSGNVHVIAKLANKIPNKQKTGFLSSSSVFRVYIQKLFWETEQSKKTPETTADWLHRYEACQEFFPRLLPADFLDYVNYITFTEQAIEVLIDDCRYDIVKRALKFARQQSGKQKQQEDSTNFSFEDVVVHLQQSQRHLETLKSDFITDLKNSEKCKDKEYLKEYDLSRSEQDKLKVLARKMALAGISVDMIHQLLQLSPIDKWKPLTVYQQAIESVVTEFRQGYSSSLSNDSKREPFDLLKNLIQSVSDHIQDGLRPFCADMSVALKPRMDILLLLEKSFELTGEDHELLLFYRSDAIVATAWQDYKLHLDDVRTDESRDRTFKSLLECSNGMTQLQALSTLLQSWPQLNSMKDFASDPGSHPWVQLLVAMVTCKPEDGNGEEAVTTLKCIQPSKPLSKQCVEHVCEIMIAENQTLSALKVMLLTDYEDLYRTAVDIMKNSEKIDESYYDDELFQFILDRGIGAELVNSKYYPPLFEYLLTNQDDGTQAHVQQLANRLSESGYDSEAGTLLLAHRGTHSALRTLDAALSVVSRWFKK
ncbi:NBAS subunit of NRZ tethering complex-like [Ptychodera flava]|uniref:NBAS subunit of NRZ tethering complex-like n=1 Tax=Ptychodera flava TaxID=63121 RepID=UPI00396A15F9